MRDQKLSSEARFEDDIEGRWERYTEIVSSSRTNKQDESTRESRYRMSRQNLIHPMCSLFKMKEHLGTIETEQ